MRELLLVSQVTRLAMPGKADVEEWLGIYNLINKNVNVIDRCGYLQTPFRFKNIFPMPQDLRGFNKTYTEVCVGRANQLIELSQRLGKPIFVLYSGGIDSTVVITSFLMAQGGRSDNLKVALNTHSIRENPNFYYKHLRGKVEIVPSETVLDSITDDHLVVGGEGNDQIFGTDIYKDIRNYAGIPFIHQKYTEKNVCDFFMHSGISQRSAQTWFSLMDEQIRATNLVEITTVKDFFWWYNFCYKWQNVYFRIPARSTNTQPLTRAFLDDYYHQFFMVPDFEKWSMLNPDKKIGDTWASYKKAAKEFIYEFSKDREYFENKTKVASLVNIFRQRKPIVAIDGDYGMMQSIDPREFYVEENSFREFLSR